jgi:hypothetical protein
MFKSNPGTCKFNKLAQNYLVALLWMMVAVVPSQGCSRRWCLQALMWPLQQLRRPIEGCADPPPADFVTLLRWEDK